MSKKKGQPLKFT